MAGQIIKRVSKKNKKTWLVRIYLGSDPKTGKKRYLNHTIKTSQSDAERYRNAVLRDLDLGSFIEPSPVELDAFLDTWLEQVARPRLSEIGFDNYALHLRLYIRPYLGTMQLRNIRPIDLQAVVGKLLAKELSPQVIRNAMAILSSALKQAVTWRMLAQNPAQQVKLPRVKRKEGYALSPEEAQRFLKAADGSRYGTLFLMAVITGLRPSEYLGLKWSDVDFKSGYVKIQRGVVWKRAGGYYISDLKTKGARRSIPLPAILLSRLAEHRKQQKGKPNPLGLVFINRSGGPVNIRKLAMQYFKPVLVAAELPARVRLYDLRHSCATILLAAGENLKVISERLGHSQINITANIYAHVLPTMQRAATDRITDILFQSDTPGTHTPDSEKPYTFWIERITRFWIVWFILAKTPTCNRINRVSY